MYSNPNINYETSVDEESHPMFLRRLNSLSSSFRPRDHPPLCWTGFRSSTAVSSPNLPQFTPAPHPWRSLPRFPPWPPRLPYPHPPVHQVFTGRTSHPFNVSGGRWRSLHSSAGCMMERPGREPPNKRLKSEEEKRSFEKKGGHRRGPPWEGSGDAKEGKPRKEHHHLESRKDGHRPNQYFKAGSRDKTKNRGDETVSRGEGNSREKDVKVTIGEHKDKHGKGSRDGTPRQLSQPATSRTQIPKSRTEQDLVSQHKPNPWFKGKTAEELDGSQRNKTRTVEQLKDGCEGGKWTGIQSRPPRTTQVPNPCQVTQADRQPPSPGIPMPVKPLQRDWETCSTEPRPPGDSTAFDFTVMSYNILSQELLQDNAYLYQHCDPAILPWDYRLPNLLAEIQQHDADILCLQEVQEDHYETQLKPALQALGYQCEFKKRTGKKPDGCAVIFKTSRFSLLSSIPVEFFRSGDALLDRDNVGLVVLLQPNNITGRSDPSSYICVANTHLLYNPRRGDIKLTQLAILLAEISRLSRLPDGSANPVVLCGDFNSVPWSPLYRFLTAGCLEYQGMQIGVVSGQETSPKGQRFLTSPIWSQELGINHQCQYEKKSSDDSASTSPTVEGGILNLTVEDLANKNSPAFKSSRIEHNLKLQSSYKHRLMPDGRPEITTCHSRTALTVDYILYSSDLPTSPSLPGGRSLQLLGRLSLVGQSELEEVDGLPNRHHSSDHLPLLTRFRFLC